MLVAGRHRVDALAAGLPALARHRRSCGNGAKGHRLYAGALIAAAEASRQELIRRSVHRPDELAFFRCHTTRPVLVTRLIKVAGTRWAIEEQPSHHLRASSRSLF